MKKLFFLCVLTFAAANTQMATALLGAAVPVAKLDQSYYDGFNARIPVGASTSCVQTFTVGITGNLSRIDVPLSYHTVWPPSSPLNDFYFPQVPVSVSLVRTSDLGIPQLDNVLASFQLNPNNIHSSGPGPLGGFSPVTPTRLNLGAMAIPVRAGDVLAIHVAAVDAYGDKTYFWDVYIESFAFFQGVTYERGTGYRYAPSAPSGIGEIGGDLNFSTYVVPIPEPTACSLLLTATILHRVVTFKKRSALEGNY